LTVDPKALQKMKKGGNGRRQDPLGPFPDFRGLFLSKKGAKTTDRAVALKQVQ